MSILLRLAVRLYARLLRLYPRRFRADFAAEMQAVFSEAINEAARRGRTSSAAVFLGEVWDLPGNVLREHWSQTEEPTMSTALSLGNSTAGPRFDDQPGAWKDAALAGLPHLLVVVLALLPLGTFKNGSTVYPLWLLVLPCFFVAALVLAGRRGWPRWSASWYVYVALLILVPVLGTPLSFAAPLAFAIGLYWITRQDPIKGLFTAMPLVLLFWVSVLEFVQPGLHNSIMLGIVLLAAAMAAAIVRLNDVRLSVWLIIGASVLTGLLAAYARTYWHNLPPEYSEPPTLAAMAGLFAPQLLAGSTLVLGPFLVWGLWKIGKCSGPAGMLGYRLALGGLALNLFGNLGYLWQSTAIIGPGELWFNAVVHLGLFLYLAGALWLGLAARRNTAPLDLASLALLVLIPSALPLMWMLPTWFGNRIVPAGFPFELYNLGEGYKYLAYAIGAVWLVLGGWLVTRLCAWPRPGEPA